MAYGGTGGDAADGNGGCARCGSLPDRGSGPGRLYLWSPLGHTLAKTRRRLGSAGWEQEEAAGGGVSVALEEGGLPGLLSELSGNVLTGRELWDTRALFKPGGEELEVTDIPRVDSLGRLASLGRSDWLLDLLSEERLTSHFQPIVRARRPEEVYAQECPY